MAGHDWEEMPALLASLREATLERGIEILEAAVARSTSDPRPLLLMAAELLKQQDVDRAEGAYLLALQRDPGCAMARFQLGLLQFVNARPAAAFATWAPLEDLPEDDPLRLFKRGLEAFGRDRFEEARTWLAAGIAANPADEPLGRDMQSMLDWMVQIGVVEGAAPSPAAARAAAG